MTEEEIKGLATIFAQPHTVIMHTRFQSIRIK